MNGEHQDQSRQSRLLMDLLDAGEFSKAEALFNEVGPMLLTPEDDIYPLVALANGHNNFDGIDWLLAHGADIDAYSKGYGTSINGNPITHAMEDLALEMVAYLLKKGASLTYRDIHGYDPFLQSVEELMNVLAMDIEELDLAKSMVNIVVEAGANVNSVNNDLESALHVICRMCFTDEYAVKVKDIVEYLCSKGMDPSLKSARGQTAIDVATLDRRYVLSSIVELINPNRAR